MITLAIDSAMNGCSVGLYDDVKGELAGRSIDIARGQAEHLMPMIENVLGEVDLAYSDVDLIAVTKGPGAFTGIRIGLAAAKALGIALDIPVHGVCTFNAVLETYLNTEECKIFPYYGVLLETKRQDFYFQMFDGNKRHPCSDKLSMSAKDILAFLGKRECAIVGDAVERLKCEADFDSSTFFYEISLPSQTVIAKLAVVEYNDNGGIAECCPVYLRPPDVGMPKTPARSLY